MKTQFSGNNLFASQTILSNYVITISCGAEVLFSSCLSLLLVITNIREIVHFDKSGACRIL